MWSFFYFICDLKMRGQLLAKFLAKVLDFSEKGTVHVGSAIMEKGSERPPFP
jgi:hypothetical protein